MIEWTFFQLWTICCAGWTTFRLQIRSNFQWSQGHCHEELHTQYYSHYPPFLWHRNYIDAPCIHSLCLGLLCFLHYQLNDTPQDVLATPKDHPWLSADSLPQWYDICSNQFVSGLTGPPDVTAVDETYSSFGKFHGLGWQYFDRNLFSYYTNKMTKHINDFVSDSHVSCITFGVILTAQIGTRPCLLYPNYCVTSIHCSPLTFSSSSSL